MRAVNFPTLFFEQAERLKDRVALRHKDFGIWHRISWREYAAGVREVAAGLVSLGVGHGDRVSILGENRPEWLIWDLAVMTADGSQPLHKLTTGPGNDRLPDWKP